MKFSKYINRKIVFMSTLLLAELLITIGYITFINIQQNKITEINTVKTELNNTSTLFESYMNYPNSRKENQIKPRFENLYDDLYLADDSLDIYNVEINVLSNNFNEISTFFNENGEFDSISETQATEIRIRLQSLNSSLERISNIRIEDQKDANLIFIIVAIILNSIILMIMYIFTIKGRRYALNLVDDFANRFKHIELGDYDLQMISKEHEIDEFKYLKNSVNTMTTKQGELVDSLKKRLASNGRQQLQIQVLNQQLSTNFHSTLKLLSRAIEARDIYTADHSKRVAQYALMIGRELNLSPEQLSDLEFAATIHDIGKIAMPDNIFLKGQLTKEEFDLIKQHPVRGAEFFTNMDFMENISQVILFHHERWDGQGYPNGLKGEEIPLHARIISVADAFDAMTTTRAYRRKMSFDEAIEELKDCSGTQFDLEITSIFVDTFSRNKSNLELSDDSTIISESIYRNTIDKLTGFYNKYYYNNYIKNDKNLELPIRIVSSKIHGLKTLNKKYDSVKGDELIRLFTVILNEHQNYGVLIRWSGTDFIQLITNADDIKAKEGIKKIRTATKHAFADYPEISFSFNQKLVTSNDDLDKAIDDLLDLD